MKLKILLPYKVFAEVSGVKKIIVETTAGSHGILPDRLDCAAALVPGIMSYETEQEGESYIALSDGIFIKAGREVLISARSAIGNAPLGKLRAMVEEEMKEMDAVEVNVRTVMARLESGFMRSFQKLMKG